MTKPELRPATRADITAAFTHLYGEARSIPVRVFGYTGSVDGKVIAVGGIAMYPNGARVAFCDISDEGRKYPLSLHRGAKIVLKQARQLGIKRVVVGIDDNHEKTPNWLAHLGFKRELVSEGVPAFVLENV